MIEAVILQAVLIFINAIFASAEIAVISMNETKLKHMVQEGNKKAGKLSALTEQPAKFLSTIQVAITLAGLLGGCPRGGSFCRPSYQETERTGSCPAGAGAAFHCGSGYHFNFDVFQSCLR